MVCRLLRIVRGVLFETRLQLSKWIPQGFRALIGADLSYFCDLGFCDLGFEFLGRFQERTAGAAEPLI
jgi:hypothetical protein